jgi:hypothetical protein
LFTSAARQSNADLVMRNAGTAHREHVLHGSFNPSSEDHFMLMYKLHTPEPRPDTGIDDDADVRQPPVPPDQQDDVVPQEDPPKPGGNPPMIA